MRVGALIVVAGVALAAVVIVLAAPGSGDQNVPEEPVETSVDEIVDVPPKFLREPVRVSGTAIPVDGERFVLRGRRDAIVVRPEPGVVDGDLRRGAAVTITGVVENFDRLQVADLRRLLREGSSPALAAAPTELEDPFLSADSVEST